MDTFQKNHKISLVDIFYHAFTTCIMNFYYRKHDYDLSQSNGMAHMAYEL
jgi:hypothetical protein